MRISSAKLARNRLTAAGSRSNTSVKTTSWREESSNALSDGWKQAGAQAVYRDSPASLGLETRSSRQGYGQRGDRDTRPPCAAGAARAIGPALPHQRNGAVQQRSLGRRLKMARRHPVRILRQPPHRPRSRNCRSLAGRRAHPTGPASGSIRVGGLASAMRWACRQSSVWIVNATANPSVVTTPTSLPPCWYASGIIVSASIVRIAPAAKASTNATTPCEACWNRP